MSFRKTWDKDHYAQKALDRAQYGDDGVEKEDTEGSKSNQSSDSHKKAEFRAASSDAAIDIMGSKRAFLQGRDKVDLGNKRVGTTQIITAKQLEQGKGAGFLCEVCNVLCKDNNSYLNHISSKNHQKALGFSTRVERVNVNAVKERLQALKRKNYQSDDLNGIDMDSLDPSKKHKQKGHHNNKDRGENNGTKKVKHDEGDRESTEQRSEAKLDTGNDKGGKEDKKDKEKDKGEEKAEVSTEDEELMKMMGFGAFGGK